MKSFLGLLVAAAIAAFLLLRGGGVEAPHDALEGDSTAVPVPVHADDALPDVDALPVVESAPPPEASRQPVKAPGLHDLLAQLPKTRVEQIERRIAARQDPTQKSFPLSLDKAVSDRQYNPERKIPDRAQEERLTGILNEFNQKDFELYLQHMHLADEALLVALPLGQIEVVPMADMDGPMSRSQVHAANFQALADAQKRLTARLGKDLVDWGWKQFSTIEYPGPHEVSIVYYTRQQAPKVFENREQMNQLWLDLRQRLTEFFAALP